MKKPIRNTIIIGLGSIGILLIIIAIGFQMTSTHKANECYNYIDKGFDATAKLNFTGADYYVNKAHICNLEYQNMTMLNFPKYW